MKLNAQLDIDLLALQRDDEVTCLLTFEAPIPEAVTDRPGETLVAVVDRSGSMHGAPLDAVRQSLHAIVDRIRPQDSFGVVVFDSSAVIAVPTMVMADHDAVTVHALIRGIEPGGTTDLSGGYLLGLSEARRCLASTGATLLLLSDGHANAGVVDPARLGKLAAKARQDRISTTTIGIGGGYDELLLQELATQGSGSHRFAATPDDAISIVSEEAGDILNKSIANAFVRIRPTDPALLPGIGTLHTLPRWVETAPDGRQSIVIPLGDLFAGETRELLVHFDVPGIAALGLHHLADFTIDYVSLPSLTAESIVWPMAVNVVPGDEAGRRIPDPTVTTARLLAEATVAKREATDALGLGDVDKAARLMNQQAERMRSAMLEISDDTPGAEALRERLAEEREMVDRLARAATEQPVQMASKSFIEDVSMNASGRNDASRRTRTRNKRDY
mgnify:CR=1 FL=1